MANDEHKNGEEEYPNSDVQPITENGQYLFFVIRYGINLPERFNSFSQAYSYALNKFCSEDFTVWNESWEYRHY
jgi:hypothetical protein